ncbi:hypothetical protein TNCV_4543631 [Trichonephila clavipes]|nr:hypothetical protein TNCV_4543631 [Trichonephila clavipes]
MHTKFYGGPSGIVVGDADCSAEGPGRKSSRQIGGRGRVVREERLLTTPMVFSVKIEVDPRQVALSPALVLNAKANDRRKNLALSRNEFRGLDLMLLWIRWHKKQQHNFTSIQKCVVAQC